MRCGLFKICRMYFPTARRKSEESLLTDSNSMSILAIRPAVTAASEVSTPENGSKNVFKQCLY